MSDDERSCRQSRQRPPLRQFGHQTQPGWGAEADPKTILCTGNHKQHRRLSLAADALPSIRIDRRRRGAAFRMGMPLAQVVYGPAALAPSRKCGLLVRRGGTKEMRPACMVGHQRRGGLGNVQVGTAPVAQQDAAGFGRAMVELAVPGEYLEHPFFDQDETVIVGSSQDEGSEHPGHPLSGETFWFLIFLASAPSM